MSVSTSIKSIQDIVRKDTSVDGDAQRLTQLVGMSFPLPPLAEQRRIVAKVDELMAVLDALEAALTTARTTAENLLAATIAKLAVSPSNPLHQPDDPREVVLQAAEDPAPYGA